MQDCTQTILGCLTPDQWAANILFALLGGLLIYGYLLYNGITKGTSTSNKLDVKHWRKNKKNWGRLLFNTVGVLLIIRLTGPLDVPQAIALGLTAEVSIETFLHKFTNPIN